MPDKFYLTSDQLVVKMLGEKEEEINKLNEKYDDLLRKYVVLQVINKKFEQVKQWFSLKETAGHNGYEINVKDKNGYFITIAYCWNKEEPEQQFLDLLDLLGLELPKEKK